MRRQLFLLSLTLFYFSTQSFAQDIRDIKGPVDYPTNILFLCLGIFVIVVFGIYLLSRYLKSGRERKKELPVVIKQPWEIAFERLEAMKSQQFITQGMLDKFYSELSDIVRQYCEDRFSIRAPEMTTEEFLSDLKNSRDLNSEQKLKLKKFLNYCDLVKFAKYSPQNKEAENSFILARNFIKETIENKRPEDVA